MTHDLNTQKLKYFDVLFKSLLVYFVGNNLTGKMFDHF